MSLSKDLRVAAPFAVVILFALGGCGQRDQIARYKVKKPELVDPTLTSVSSSAKGPATEQQTVGLIVPVGEQSWFFKLTGDAKVVEPYHEAFVQFVSSIKFSGSGDLKPTWTLPVGWKELPGSQFRYATIQLPAEGKPLEISVSSAGGDLLANINRWRDQLKLPPLAGEDLGTSTKSLKIDGREATLVSFVGKGSGQMGGAPFAPFAGGGAMPADHPPLSKGILGTGSASPSASGKISFDAPPQWKPTAIGAFGLAAFKAEDEENGERVEITVSTAGGDLLANVNRWRGQIGLSPIDTAALADAVENVDTLGVSGAYVELIGPATAPKRETILGVRADAGGQTWFVKLKGDAELAAREKSRFEAFVKSLKLRE